MITSIDEKNTKLDITTPICCDDSIQKLLTSYINYFISPFEVKQVLHVEIHKGIKITWESMFKIYMAIQYKCIAMNANIESIVFYIHSKTIVKSINRLVDLLNPTIPFTLTCPK